MTGDLICLREPDLKDTAVIGEERQLSFHGQLKIWLRVPATPSNAETPAGIGAKGVAGDTISNRKKAEVNIS